MRDLFDRRLTDPTAAEVADALRAAVAAVNTKRQYGNLPAIEADGLGMRVAHDPAGRFVTSGGGVLGRGLIIGRLVLAWWTNPAGRKLVRVRGWDDRDRDGLPMTPEAHAFTAMERDLNRRPLVWHVDPEHVVEAFTGGDPEWVAVCGCGTAGSAESLGWHHGMCGPCADRVAEFGPDAVEHAPGLLGDAGFVPREVVFTADGKFVVAAGADEYRVWDAATGTPRATGAGIDLLPGVRTASSPDGRLVVLGDGGSSVLLLAPADNTVDTPFATDDEIRAVQWTGRPAELLLQTADERVQLANTTDGHIREPVVPPDRNARLSAVWPDAAAPRAVFAADHHASVVRVERDGTLTTFAKFSLGDGRLNRTGVWEGGPKVVRFTPDGERLLFIRGAEMELRLPSRPKALQQVEFRKPVADACFAPDGERLYVLTTDGVIHVCNPGMLTSVRARLRWHIEPATRLAIAPDGRTLATAGPEGVKLWPVASLLPLLE